MMSEKGNCYLTNVVVFDLLPRLEFLRVLSLSGYLIIELPNELFVDLKHLHYLDFSFSDIKCLPDSLCTLYHLETLILKGCKRLEKLPAEMENLINLHYLDIRGADLVKKMPFGIGKLTNLEKLSNFILEEGDGRRILEMKNLSDLKGNLCLSGLENIVKHQDAFESRLSDKRGVDSLKLKWSDDFDENIRNKEVEERVLNALRPQNKLEKLTIKNYSGAKFSTWLVDASFKNLLILKLINCKNCVSLPSIGKLSLLKHLFIKGMYKVRKVGAELLGENQPHAFASLERLCFEDMPNWEDWNCCESDSQGSKFPSLRELSIIHCPLLLGWLPNHLPSLQVLRIKYCKRLVVSISSTPLLCELVVGGCEELRCNNATDVSSLKSIFLYDIAKFTVPPEMIMSRLTKLESFWINDCKAVTSFLSKDGLGLLGHLNSLREIKIWSCPQLIFSETEEVDEETLQLGKVCSIQYLDISDIEWLYRIPKVLCAFTFLVEICIENCPQLICFADNSFPPALKKLKIVGCDNLRYFVDEIENNKINETCVLEHMEILRCNSLRCILSRDDLLPQLQYLCIRDCSKLTCLFENAKLPIRLQKLYIHSCPELECIAQELFDETTCLESIWVSSCQKIKSLPRGLNKLGHLQEFHLEKLPSLVCFEEESGIPSAINLRDLWLSNLENFGVLPNCMYKFTSLQKLRVEKCSVDIFYPEEGFPTNLTSLVIRNAPKFYKSLVQWGFDRLTSLKYLEMSGEGCSDVVSFPEEDMMLPPSITDIAIFNFENLKYMLSSGFQNLTSLKKLLISDCSNIVALPEKNVLLSLENLCVEGCPLLRKELQRGKGREWSKIAHIPLAL